LRQDPDIILVGETRTKETAQIAINAALTGHLVFTTLHTNSVLDSLSRLMNMGVEPYLLTPALQLVIGQRLVRKACPHCSTREDATPEENAEILAHLEHIQKFHPDFGSSYQGKVLRTKGCEHCNHSGYSGRIAILELLEITDDLRAKILKNPYGQDLTEMVKESDFLPLQDDGILKVISGETTLEEVHRVSY
ncbi:Flp pilus assembly complex ATPase component TadA, partial [Candidatus Gracilibacteria bacterium]|nr:Flp pilus assembly complex ATPase component TadA [Candidatus Gracilibacteria bacterium]